MNTKEKEKFKPTSQMASQAKEGLKLREEYGRGGIAVGVARANQLAKQEEIPIETVARIYSYFKRHTVDKKGKGWNKGEEGYPSAGLIAWKLWGGDAGEKWATQIWEKHKEENKALDDFEVLFDEDSSDELMKAILKAISIKND